MTKPQLPPDLAAIERMAQAAIDRLPAPYAEAARKVVLRIEDFAADDVLAALGCDSPFDLTGLYEGIPLTEKSYGDQPLQPDLIWLFRRPILDEWVERGEVDLADLVAHVLVHELAHHFGWSDADIAHVDEWWE